MGAQQQAASEAMRFVARANEVVLFPLITLLVALAFFLFLYGCVEYIINAENDSARETGRKHILWGIIGIVVMLSAYALLSIAVNTFGLRSTLDCATNPTAANCATQFQVR
jgi:Type IV secretion system pilin